MTHTGKPGDENTEPETTHDETAPTADSSEETTPRLSIPSNLWDTGLFKPAWARPSSTGTSDSPPRSRGSLLSRPEDLDPQPEDPDPQPQSAPTRGGIDPDLVVPASLAAFATGVHPVVSEAGAEEEPAPAGPDEESAAAVADEAVTEEEPAAEEPTEADAGPATQETAEVRVVEPVITPIPSQPETADEPDVDAAAEPEAEAPAEPEVEAADESQAETEAADEPADEGDEPDAEPDADPAAEETGEQTALPLSPIEATEAAAAAAAAGAATEAAAEAEADSAPDVEDTPDANPDAALDSDPDAEPDADPDADPDTEPNAEPNAEPDVEPEPTQLVPRQSGPADATQLAARRVEEPTRVTPAAAPPTAPRTAPPTAPTAVVPPVGDGPATATTVVPVDEEPRRRGKGLAILLAMVVVVALIGGGWFLWQRNQDGPVRDAFGESHGAFVSAATQLTAAESLDDVAAASDDFAEATALLEQTRSTAGGRTSSLSTSVRRAVAAQLEVSQAAEQLTGLGEQDYAAWGAVRADLKSGLESLEGVHDDIELAGGTTGDLPSSDVVTTTDEMVLTEARRSAQQRTRRATTDLAGAEVVKDLRGVGRRTSTGATQLAGAVDSLGGADVDTSGLEAHRTVQEALGRLTRLKPATLNEWEAIRTRADRAADDLPDEAAAALKAALTSADTMVTAADEAWDAWLAESEDARTAKTDDLEAVRNARTELDTLLQEFRGLDGELASYLGSGTAAEGGPDSAPRTTLVEAADARDGLRTRVSGLGIPAELAEETYALEAALSSHAATVRAAADAAATCVLTCRVPDTPAWQTLVAQRGAQATAVGDAVQAWRDAAQDALKEIRQRELPEKPQI